MPPININITPLSPIFIGCGEDYDLTNYIIGRDEVLPSNDSSSEINVFYGFNPTSVELSSSEISELLEASKSSNRSDWAKFFRDHSETFIAYARNVCFCPKDVADTYRGITDGKKKENQGIIRRNVYTRLPEEDVPYIPGSSVKGAFVTALLDNLNLEAEKVKPKEDFGKSGSISQLSKKILEINIDKKKQFPNWSPFRFLKISDCLATNETYGLTEIAGALRVEKGKPPEDSIPSTLEVMSFGSYRPYEGSITWADMPQKIAENFNKTKWPSFQECIKAVHKYNCKEFEKGLNSFWSNWSGAQKWADSVLDLLKELEALINEGKVCLIRLGGNQGASGLTLTGHAQIKVRIKGEKEPIYIESPTTVNMCCVRDMELPFGWALLEADCQDQNSPLQKWLSSQNKAPFDALRNREARRLKKKELRPLRRQEKEQRIVEARARKEEEEERKRAEEQRRIQEELVRAKEEERRRNLSENVRRVEDLANKMEAPSKINPNDAFYKEVKDFLEKAAQEWSPEDKLMCAEKLQPLVKAKGMYQGKNEKILKNLFKTMRGQ